MRLSWVAWIGVWAGCSQEDTPGEEASDGDGTDEPGPETGACGAVTSFQTTVHGFVTDAADRPLPFAEVWLEERNWAPGEKGRTTSDAAGIFAVPVDIPVVEDCWGVATQFWLVGESDGLTGEWPATRILLPAYTYGEDADMGTLPLILE